MRGWEKLKTPRTGGLRNIKCKNGGMGKVLGEELKVSKNQLKEWEDGKG